jgi:pyruvate-formate lyase-activating enzyme
MASENTEEPLITLTDATVAEVKTIRPDLYDAIVETGHKKVDEQPVVGPQNLSGEELQKRCRKLERENTEMRARLAVHQGATMTDQQLREQFAQTKELQDQFTCADAYVASVRHPAKL